MTPALKSITIQSLRDQIQRGQQQIIQIKAVKKNCIKANVMWYQALNSVGVRNRVKPRITWANKESFWRMYNLNGAAGSRSWTIRRVGNLEKQVV